MKFEKRYIVGALEIGKINEITNYGLLAFLEDVAGSHSDSIGYGVKDVATTKRAWLLMDWKLHVLKRPSFNEEICVKTWTGQIDKPAYSVYRNFEAFNKNNELILDATSKWIFYNVEENKLTKVDKDIISLYNPEGDAKDDESKIVKLTEPSAYESVFKYKTRRSDIDINKHMHNLNYLNLAYEALPEDIYNAKEFDNVRIMYKHQIKLGDNIKCFYGTENNRHYVTIKSEDEKILHAIIELY